MNSFKAYFKKETLEAMRHYKYLIIGFGILFFSISTPIMLKLLPSILKSQASGMDISSLMKFTIKSGLQSYIKDLFQIGNMFVVLALSSILSDEINLKKLVFPYTKNVNPCGMVLAKYIHYALLVIGLVFIGFIINYNYCNLLFKGDDVALNKVLFSASLIAVYLCFNLSLVTCLSSFFKKGIAAGIITLMISYLSPLISNIKAIEKFNPYYLVSAANKFDIVNVTTTLSLTLILCVIFVFIAVERMKRIDVQ